MPRRPSIRNRARDVDRLRAVTCRFVSPCRRGATLAALALLLASAAAAQEPAPAALPPEIARALARAGVPPENVALLVAPLLPNLLAGRLVVGVGNIYASEALFLAGIRPTMESSRIGPTRARRLYEAIRQVLELAVQRGGSTLRNFSSADGSVGHFQSEARVYGREGAPCHTCGTAVRMVRQGQRSSYFCPRCQRA